MTRATIRRVSTFGVGGLTCPDCLVLLMERVRHLLGVREVTVDLEPAGESSLTIAPAEAVSAEDIRAVVDEIGFDYIARRSHRRPPWTGRSLVISLIHSKAGGPEFTHLP